MNRKFLASCFLFFNFSSFIFSESFPKNAIQKEKNQKNIKKKKTNETAKKNSKMVLRTQNELRKDPLITVENFNFTVLNGEEKQSFQKIFNLFNEKKYKKCIAEAEKFQENYITSKARPTIYLYIAISYFMSKKNSSATIALNIFLELYSFKKEEVLAKYLIGICNYDDIISIHKDTKSVRRAYKHFLELYAEFSEEKNPYIKKYVSATKERIIELNNYLSEIDMDVGKFYLKHESFIAAMNRFKAVVDSNLENVFREEACYRLIEIELSLKMFREALKTNEYMNKIYGNSSWTTFGNNLIKEFSQAK